MGYSTTGGHRSVINSVGAILNQDLTIDAVINSVMSALKHMDKPREIGNQPERLAGVG